VPAAPGAAEPSPRLAAVESEIRLLERHLQGLRKARTELHAGRAEPAPANDEAVRAREADVRALREVSRYEAARAKALAAAAQAAAAKDEGKAAEARAALEAADRGFLQAVERVTAAREAARGDGKADATPAPGQKPAGTRRRAKSSAETDDMPEEDDDEG
jgi:hypothetical protein